MSKQEATLENVYSPIGHRDVRKDNTFGLNRIDHFALPTRNIALMERFIRELLGGEPYYYAGFDEVDRKMGRSHHIFIRVGDVLMQCTETDDGSMIIRKDDPNIAPHIAFKVSADDLTRNFERLSEVIPVAGPFRHRGVDVVSFYFMSPEGHKLEICTWEPYPEEKARMMGAPDVGIMKWADLVHDWPNQPE
ncbi:VOC domain-containing protein [Cupriavidus oxalaticus]|uniref:VOC family protein n=1 Tax=Cupriavidus oxalaticus TaxID=96344 RepID=UPI003F73A26A